MLGLCSLRASVLNCTLKLFLKNYNHFGHQILGVTKHRKVPESLGKSRKVRESEPKVPESEPKVPESPGK